MFNFSDDAGTSNHIHVNSDPYDDGPNDSYDDKSYWSLWRLLFRMIACFGNDYGGDIWYFGFGSLVLWFLVLCDFDIMMVYFVCGIGLFGLWYFNCMHGLLGSIFNVGALLYFV